jgi:hypothetical protein
MSPSNPLLKDGPSPMLKTWLDDILPGIVERLVSAEIERVARGDGAAWRESGESCPYPSNWAVARRQKARSTGATRTLRSVLAMPVLALRKSSRGAASISWPR